MSSGPMLAENFFDSHQQREFRETGEFRKGFVFLGDSGEYRHHHWVFTPQPTLYKLDPTSWFVSVKIDGIRAQWNAKKRQLTSRSGMTLYAPTWFIKCLPKSHSLDGELWAEGHTAAQVSGMVRRKCPDDAEWGKITFYAFDILGVKKPFCERWSILSTLKQSQCLNILQQTQVHSMHEAYAIYQKALMDGFEGVVLKAPDAYYEHRRSSNMLKWKPVLSKEARIIGYIEGRGKFKGHLGALEVVMLDDESKIFHLSGRLPDDFRKSFQFKNGQLVTCPDLPSDIVTFEYMELHEDSGLPRQPVFVSFRDML